MKNKWIPFITLLVLFSLLLTGCAGTTTPKPSTEEAELPAEADIVEEETTAAETAEPEATQEPTAEPIPPCTIAFQTDRDGNWEIYSMAPDGSELVNLTKNETDDTAPAFSPDGSRIAFVSNRSDGDEGGQFIYVMDADGGNARKLDSEDGSNHPAWSPTGEHIIYDNGNDIFIIKADGSEPLIQLTDSPEKDVQPDFSPEDDFITWISGDDNNANILVMDLRSFEIQQITPDAGVTDAQWTVDAEIFFHGDGELFGCFNCVMSADGSNIRDAGGKGRIQEFIPFWTLDGDRVECVSANIEEEDNEEIYLVSEIYPDIFLNLTKDPGNDRNPTWPDRCGLSYEAADDDSTQDATSPEDAEFIIGYEDADEVMTVQQRADLEQACSKLPIVCVMDDFDALIEQDVDAIISFSSRWHVLGSAPQIYDAVGRGIPVIILNAESDASGAYNLSIDSEAIRSSSQWMFKNMEGTGEFIYFVFGQNAVHLSTVEEVLKEYPGISATSMPAEYGNDSFNWEYIKSLIDDNPNLGAIWSDEGVQELLIAGSGILEGQPPYMICDPREDMLTMWKEATEVNPLFQCYSTIYPGGTAYEGVYFAYYLLSGFEINPDKLGGPFGNTLYYDYPVITNQNLDEWLNNPDGIRESSWGTYFIAPMTPEQILEAWFVQ